MDAQTKAYVYYLAGSYHHKAQHHPKAVHFFHAAMTAIEDPLHDNYRHFALHYLGW